jgi:hypothetical protein
VGTKHIEILKKINGNGKSYIKETKQCVPEHKYEALQHSIF